MIAEMKPYNRGILIATILGGERGPDKMDFAAITM